MTRNTKRKTPHHHKRLIWRWKYVRGINHVIYKKKKKNLKMNFFFLNKENSTAPLKAGVKVEICWGNKLIYKRKKKEKKI